MGTISIHGEEIRPAHAITPITAIQSEYSMMERMYEKDVIPTCEKLGIGFCTIQSSSQWISIREIQGGQNIHR
jgi:aryl-alcohol dehydrogenase-like predicted oxidoreductase